MGSRSKTLNLKENTLEELTSIQSIMLVGGEWNDSSTRGAQPRLSQGDRIWLRAAKRICHRLGYVMTEKPRLTVVNTKYGSNFLEPENSPKTDLLIFARIFMPTPEEYQEGTKRWGETWAEMFGITRYHSDIDLWRRRALETEPKIVLAFYDKVDDPAEIRATHLAGDSLRDITAQVGNFHFHSKVATHVLIPV